MCVNNENQRHELLDSARSMRTIISNPLFQEYQNLLLQEKEKIWKAIAVCHREELPVMQGRVYQWERQFNMPNNVIEHASKMLNGGRIK